MNGITFTALPAQVVTNAIDRMATTKAIAEWEAAGKILASYAYDENLAVLQTQLAVGHGIDQHMADHLVYLIHELAKEI